MFDMEEISINPYFLSGEIGKQDKIKLLSFWTSENLIRPRQGGFRPKHSTKTTTLHVLTDVLALNDRERAGGAFIDLRKAFHSINHSMPLNKLTSNRLMGKEHKWLTSYLANRKQRVYLNNKVANII